MRIAVLNGVNLDVVGRRDPELYGGLTIDELETRIYEWATELELTVRCRHTNHEGEYIDWCHDALGWADGVIVNDVRDHLKRAMAHHRGMRDDTLTIEQAAIASAGQRIRTALNQAQSREIERLHNEGAINKTTMTKLQRELDLEAVRAT